MTVESYRIDLPGLLDESAGFRRRVNESLADLKLAGVLVPDTRLQAIADAWSSLTQREQEAMSTECYRFVRRVAALTEENN